MFLLPPVLCNKIDAHSLGVPPLTFCHAVVIKEEKTFKQDPPSFIVNNGLSTFTFIYLFFCHGQNEVKQI